MRNVLITGGEGDIAQAIRICLEKLGGYNIKTPGRKEMDVTNIDSVKNYVSEFIPDILINNAGYVNPMSIRDCDISTEMKSIDINLFGVFNCSAMTLRKNPGAFIINIGSSAATKLHGTWSSYCATKAGVVMATQCWADDGVHAICISPGRTATKMRKGLYPNEDIGSLLQTSDFARVIVKAINGEYPNGVHINVTKDNVTELLKS